MGELIQIAEHTFYLPGPTKIGLVKSAEQGVCLIDSGNDKSAGRAIRKILDAHHWQLQAIYNTHSHADHIGGNKYLQAQTGCRIYTPGIEQDFTRHPILEPSLLYGGYPCAALRNKFLLAQDSCAEPLTPEALPIGMESIPLPGHSFDMVGYRTVDDVVFLADCLASQATLEKYRICFVYDVAAYIRTLEMVQQLKAAVFIPSHAEPTEDIGPLVRYNLEQVYSLAEDILTLCREPIGFEELLKRLFDTYSLTLSIEQYALTGSAIRSYLSWLADAGRMAPIIHRNRLLWQASQP